MSARLVVVPMKDPALAKTRLGAVLPAARRARLASLLFTRVLHRLQRAQADATHPFEIATVTASPAIAELARGLGVRVIPEGATGGLNAAIRQAAGWAVLRGHHGMAVLPGDLAAPTQRDLLALLNRPVDPDRVVICASADGGTNALLLPLPARMDFHYGPGSFVAHCAAARAAGLDPETPALASLRHDIDRQEDLSALLTHPTRATLAEVRP